MLECTYEQFLYFISFQIHVSYSLSLILVLRKIKRHLSFTLYLYNMNHSNITLLLTADTCLKNVAESQLSYTLIDEYVDLW